MSRFYQSLNEKKLKDVNIVNENMKYYRVKEVRLTSLEPESLTSKRRCPHLNRPFYAGDIVKQINFQECPLFCQIFNFRPELAFARRNRGFQGGGKRS